MLKTILGLMVIAVLPVTMSVVLYYMGRREKIRAKSYAQKQIVIGVLFGLLAIAGTEFGVDLGGVAANARDAAPLCAGLIFGSPAGLIAGFMGGIERWFAIYWGAGTYTRLACTVSTCLAGVIGAVLRKYLFENKIPSGFYAFFIGVVTETFHMLSIFVFNMDDVGKAFSVVRKCAVPMILVNSLAVCVAVILVRRSGHKQKKYREVKNQISMIVQKHLIQLVLLGFIITGTFTFVLQNHMGAEDADQEFMVNLGDVKQDILDTSDNNLLDLTNKVKAQLELSTIPVEEKIDELAIKFDVAEINIIDNKGIITASSNKEFIGFDMNSGEQAREFLILLNDGVESYVQEYTNTTYDPTVGRKYAGVKYGDGILQVGYDAVRFQRDVDLKLVNATKNRHIGHSGYILLVDYDWNIVRDLSSGTSVNLSDAGIYIDIDTMQPQTRFEATVYDVPSYFMYDICEGYYIVGVMPKDEAMLSRNMSTYLIFMMELIVFIALFIAIYYMVKRLVVDNVRKINSNLAEISGGNLDVVVDVRGNDEFASLSDDINATVDTLKHYIEEAAARLDKELEVATNIQTSALPTIFPPFPERTDFILHATMDTAKEVGGDFYDFYLLDETHLVILIADVSGKGIPAAMFMMQSKTILKDYAESGRSIDDVFTEANAKLCENNDAGMFVTAWMGIVDLATGVVEFANAGHNPPLIRRNNGEYDYFVTKPSLVLAGMEGIMYRKGELVLEPGDEIFLYTDGVTEATSLDNELYGEDRLKAVLNRDMTVNREELCAKVRADVDAFVGEAPQFDDITMLSFKYNGPGYIEGADMNELKIEAKIENLQEVISFVEQQLEAYDCSMKVITQIDVAVEEIFVNIAHYAYNPEVGQATLQVEVKNDPLTVAITFIDHGVPYDPLAKADPDTTLSAEERDIGGLGIFMVKKSMDDVQYEYKDGQNILTIKKQL